MKDAALISDGLEPTKQELTWGMWAHLGILTGFFVPFGHLAAPAFVALTHKSDYVRHHAREAFNFGFGASMVVWLAGIGWVAVADHVLRFGPDRSPESMPGYAWAVLGTAGGILIAVKLLVWVIDAARRAQEGVRYRYPMVLLRVWKP